MNDKLMDNYLHGTDIYLYQRKDMFRSNTDTFLLGQFLKVNVNESVLDIGTNNGALLLYCKKYNPKLYVGVDIQKEAIDLAKINLERNEINNYQLFCCDIKDFNYEPFDIIISNPPYFINGKYTNENESIKIARHEIYLPFDNLCESVNRLLKNDGRFYFVHRYDQFERLKKSLNKNNLYIKTYQYVLDKRTNKYGAILIEATKLKQLQIQLADFILD